MKRVILMVFSSVVGLGSSFLFFITMILRGLLEILMMTGGGGWSLLEVEGE